MGQAWVYILGNKGGMTYIGATVDLQRRIYEHKTKAVHGYTKKYSVNQLWFFEEFNDFAQAFEAERHLKGLLKSKKFALIRKQNPKFEDLSKDWFEGL